jgi:histidyl-tRNA synthetase
VVLLALQTLRSAGVSVQMHASTGEGMGSMKSQFKRADASGAQYALIFGEDELSQHRVTIKSLRDGTGAQTSQSLVDIVSWAPTLQSRT